MYINFKQHKTKTLKKVLNTVYGIDTTAVNFILKRLNCDEFCKISDLNQNLEQKIINMLSNELITSNKLIKNKYENLQKMKEVNCYKHIRHLYKLPVNGQNTKNNAKTKRK